MVPGPRPRSWMWGEGGELGRLYRGEGGVRERVARERERVLELLGEGVRQLRQSLGGEGGGSRLRGLGRELRRLRSKSAETLRRRRGASPAQEEVEGHKEEEEGRNIEEEEMRRLDEEERVSEREEEMKEVLRSPTVCWARARVDCVPSPYDR